MFPVQHDSHPFSCHAGHGVVVVPKQRNAHHRNAVVHGLVDAVQATVAQEGPCVGVTCRRRMGQSCLFCLVIILKLCISEHNSFFNVLHKEKRKFQVATMVQQPELVWLSLFAVDTEHPTNSFMANLTFHHAGGDSFTVQQLTNFYRYDSDLLILIHLN